MITTYFGISYINCNQFRLKIDLMSRQSSQNYFKTVSKNLQKRPSTEKRQAYSKWFQYPTSNQVCAARLRSLLLSDSYRGNAIHCSTKNGFTSSTLQLRVLMLVLFTIFRYILETCQKSLKFF